MTAPHPSPSSLTVRAPEDLLAVAPVVLGFAPSDSVVLLTFGAGAFHARADLPPPDDPAALAATTAALVMPVRRHRVARAAVLVYTDDARAARVAATALADGLRGAGAQVLDCLRAHDGRWWPALGGRRATSGPGLPYDAGSHPFAAQSVLDGRVRLPSRAALAASLAPLPAEVAAVRDAALVLAPPSPDDPEGPPWWARERAWAAELVATHQGARTLPDRDDLARLVVGLATVGLRDAVWAVTPPAAHGEQARAAADFWAEVVRRCPRRWRAPAAALLAYCAWNSGNGALAWCAVDVAEDADPEHSLTGLVADLLSAAVRPGSFDPADALEETVVGGGEAP